MKLQGESFMIIIIIIIWFFFFYITVYPNKNNFLFKTASKKGKIYIYSSALFYLKTMDLELN